MSVDTAGGGTRASENAPRTLRQRAERARVLAARYRGEAAAVLIEIADAFDAQAASLEPDAAD